MPPMGRSWRETSNFQRKLFVCKMKIFLNKSDCSVNFQDAQPKRKAAATTTTRKSYSTKQKIYELTNSNIFSKLLCESFIVTFILSRVAACCCSCSTNRNTRLFNFHLEGKRMKIKLVKSLSFAFFLSKKEYGEEQGER